MKSILVLISFMLALGLAAFFAAKMFVPVTSGGSKQSVQAHQSATDTKPNKPSDSKDKNVISDSESSLASSSSTADSSSFAPSGEPGGITIGSHKNRACALISNTVDSLLYDDSSWHGSMASCSSNAEWLMIKPRKALTPEQMTRFVFLTFAVAGFLQNNDLEMPPKVFVGYGGECQMMAITDAGTLQETAKFHGYSGMVDAVVMAKSAPAVVCPR